MNVTINFKTIMQVLLIAMAITGIALFVAYFVMYFFPPEHYYYAGTHYFSYQYNIDLRGVLVAGTILFPIGLLGSLVMAGGK